MTDLMSLKFDLKTVVLLLTTLTTAYGVYYGIRAKLDQQQTTITRLESQLEQVDRQLRAEERAIIELTVTLKAKGVLQ